MVIFDELRVTNDGEYLIIDARIREEFRNKGVKIIDVVVGNQNTYRNGESNGVHINLDLNMAENSGEDIKRVYLKLSAFDLTDFQYDDPKKEVDLKEDLIYVYIETTPYTGTDTCNMPCDMTQTLNIGVTLYMGYIYNNFLTYMNDLNRQTCEAKVPQGLIDMLLKFTALTTAVDSKHFDKANEFFNKWFTGRNIFKSNSNCGCNG